MQMAIDLLTRRRFLQQASAIAVLPLMGCGLKSSIDGYALFGAWRNESGQHGAGRIQAGLPQQSAMPTRGHHIEIIDGNEAWLFARRPSEYMQRVNWRTGKVLHTYSYDSSRAGFGHGIMHNGLLFTTDQDLDTDIGLLSVRHGKTGEVLQEFSTGGIGPHELLAMSDGRYIAIANGGILTRPELGRMKLNLADMQPSLSLLDVQTGRIVHNAKLPDASMSIRHLAHLPQDSIGIALQYESAEVSPKKNESPSVAAIWRVDSGLRLLNAPTELLDKAQGYAASAVSDGERYFAVSCPKANQVFVWDKDGNWLTALNIPKVYGLAAAPIANRLIVSSENGSVHYYNTRTWLEVERERQKFPVIWDNHLKVVKI